MKYSVEFKKAAVQKILTRGQRQLDEIVQELGVSRSAIYCWQDKFANVGGMKNQTKPQSRSVIEKLKAVTEYNSLPGDKRGEYLRTHGLHHETIAEWYQQITDALSSKKKISKEEKALRIEKRRSKNLEQDLKRKDQALAEVSALLILKKKADLIWGLEEDE